ncbi:MAG: cytochrome c3 family protein, partial [Stellaceae bacterium]
DAAITIEMVHPLGDSLERIVAASRMGLMQAGWNKRRWSWGLFVLFAIIGLALPIAFYPAGPVATSSRSVPQQGLASYVSLSWNPGEISNPHRFFAWNCSTCHTAAFTSVPDKACLTCHSGVGSHFQPATDLGSARQELESTRCAECHEEHRGVHSLVIRSDSLCVDCHANLQQKAPKAGIESVDGFPNGHPQFRATLVADAAGPRFTRATLGTKPPPQDHPGLTFSHAAHLVATGLPTLQGIKVLKVLTCADCHKPDPAGQGFEPVSFEADCHSCHDLKFDTQLPWAEVPHGNVALVQSSVDDFYAKLALQGGVQDASAPAIVRRPAGSPVEPTPVERKDALAWAAGRASAALSLIDDPKRGCAYCHDAS